MLRRGRYFLAGSLLFLFATSSTAAGAQVLSVVQDTGGSYLVLNTTRDTTLLAPSVHYYNQADGTTVMTADFLGLIWNQPPQVFNLRAPLKKMKLGQFQSSPPILRIIVAGTNAAALNNVKFRAAPGMLAISLNTAPDSAQAQAQAQAPANLAYDDTTYGAAPAQGDDRGLATPRTVVRWHAPPDAFTRTNLLKGVNIVLDAGHGGSDPGAQRGTIQEKVITLEIVEKLSYILTALGAQVSLTRSDDTFISVQDRVKLSLAAHPDIFLSVHINSLETNTVIHGIETYYRTEQSLPLAECVHDALVGRLDAPDRGVRSARFYVINHTPIPSILAEVGFISNQDERTNLASSEYQDKIVGALKDGVVSYLSRCADTASRSRIENVTAATLPHL